MGVGWNGSWDEIPWDRTHASCPGQRVVTVFVIFYSKGESSFLPYTFEFQNFLFSLLSFRSTLAPYPHLQHPLISSSVLYGLLNSTSTYKTPHILESLTNFGLSQICSPAVCSSGNRSRLLTSHISFSPSSRFSGSRCQSKSVVLLFYFY